MNSVRSFTSSLSDLLESGLTLRESLAVLSCPKQNAARFMKREEKVAAELLALLERGFLFSNALSSCLSLRFEKDFISFIEIAEETENIPETFAFLKNREERKAETHASMIGALLYPLFIICLITAGCFYIAFRANTVEGIVLPYITGRNVSKLALHAVRIILLFLASFFLLSIGGIYFLKKTEKEYEVAAALNFLTKSGVHLPEALQLAVLIAGADSEQGKKIEAVMVSLDAGASVADSFSQFGWNCSFSKAIRIACASGNESQLFMRAADFLKKRTDRVWRKSMTMTEPVCTACAGICLLIAAKVIAVPVMTGLSGIF